MALKTDYFTSVFSLRVDKDVKNVLIERDNKVKIFNWKVNEKKPLKCMFSTTKIFIFTESFEFKMLLSLHDLYVFLFFLKNVHKFFHSFFGLDSIYGLCTNIFMSFVAGD